jgi:hypothetical protein
MSFSSFYFDNCVMHVLPPFTQSGLPSCHSLTEVARDPKREKWLDYICRRKPKARANKLWPFTIGFIFLISLFCFVL